MTFWVPVDIICSWPEPIEWYQVWIVILWYIIAFLSYIYLFKKIKGFSQEVRQYWYYVSLFIFSFPFLYIFEFYFNFGELIWEYIKDSKDVLLWFLGVIFAIYIPFLLYFYQEIAKKTQYKMLDLYLFQSRIFNLKQIIWSLIFLVLILLFWNKQEKSDYFILNTIILAWSIPVWIFLIKNLFNLYNLNLELNNENSSWKLDDLRIEGLRKLDINNENIYIWNDTMQDINFQETNFTKQFFDILFEKVKVKIKWIWKREYLEKRIIDWLFQKYNNLEQAQVNYSFFSQDIKKIFEILEVIYEKWKHEYSDYQILNTLIDRMEKNVWDFWPVEIISFLHGIKDENIKNKLLFSLHNKILNSKILLENSDFMDNYGREIFLNYQSILMNPTIWKIIDVIHYSDKYDSWVSNILNYLLLNFEPILFAELLYLFFTPYGENRAKSILDKKFSFWLIWRVKTYWADNEVINNYDYKNETEETIQNFKKYFAINKEELSQLKEQFQALIDEGKLDENKIHYAKIYISLIEKLLAD